MTKERGIYHYTVQPREVDLTKRATIFAMGDYVLHTAGEDADQNGFGIRALNDGNMSWVLSRMAIEINRYPNEYEQFVIETWVGDIGRLMTTRNFVIKDTSGEVIGGACTQWAMIDLNTRGPLDLRTNPDYISAIREEEPPITRPTKVAKVDGELCEQRTIKYSDIDFNQHTNSMRYVQWMVDTQPLEMLTNRRLQRLDINFMHETRYADQIALFASSSQTQTLFEIQLPDKTAVCKAAISWHE